MLSQSDAQFAQLWASRESLPAAQTRAGGNLKHDISLPLDKLAAFDTQARAAIEAPN